MTDLPAPTVSEILEEIDEWQTTRDELNRREDAPGEGVDSDEWHNSDDLAVELLHLLSDAVRNEQRQPQGGENWTVTIVGPEEDDGEALYLYVARTEHHQHAAALAETAHRVEGDPATEIRRTTVMPGLPRNGDYFNDLREETDR